LHIIEKTASWLWPPSRWTRVVLSRTGFRHWIFKFAVAEHRSLLTRRTAPRERNRDGRTRFIRLCWWITARHICGALSSRHHSYAYLHTISNNRCRDRSKPKAVQK